MSRTDSQIACLEKSVWQHSEIGQKVLYENHRQDLSRSQQLQQRRLGPFTVTKRVTNTTYQIQDDKDPTNLETVHQNQLV